MPDAKAAFGAFKSHWFWLTVGVLGVVIAALWYDHKNAGDLTKKVASIPLVGKLFT